MKVLWLFPQSRKCGISIYSNNYIEQLKKKCEIITCTIDENINLKENLSAKTEIVDLIHIQYETSFFMNKGKDRYFSILSKINKPVIVTLHEIYDEFPMVYPRSKIRGWGPILILKRMIYDFKHPVQAAFKKHCKKKFGADLILVHQQYHRNILGDKGINTEFIEVLEQPVKKCMYSVKFQWNTGDTLHLGSTGFINPGYDYDLLFSVLERLEIKWDFTWIGGIRDENHDSILLELNKKITDHGWKERFILTGWVSDEKQNELLKKIDIYFSFFKFRSSSGSICRAIGALKPIIATEIPLTKELFTVCGNDGLTGPVVAVKSDPEMIISSLRKILENKMFRDDLLHAVKLYSEKMEFSSMADRMISIYRRFCR